MALAAANRKDSSRRPPPVVFTPRVLSPVCARRSAPAIAVSVDARWGSPLVLLIETVALASGFAWQHSRGKRRPSQPPGCPIARCTREGAQLRMVA
jgi:hypothetical protein